MDAVECPAKPTIIHDLALNAVALGLCSLLQFVMLALQGPTHAAWCVYLGAIAGLLVVALISLGLAHKNHIAGAMNLYAWSAMAALLTMTAAGMRPDDDLPALMVLLISLGAPWLYKFLNWPSALAYTIAAALSFITLGIVYKQLDDAIPAAIFVGACYRFGEDLWQGFRLRVAVRIKTNGGRSPGV